MSHKVVTLVCSRIVGSAAAKAVLTNMADKASDGGEGIFCSKATIAAETELGVSTVRRVFVELLDRGLIREAGKRHHANGHTVIYDMEINAIEALPEWKPRRTPPAARPLPQRDPSQSETPPKVTPLPQREATPPRTRGHPSQSETQTILEPSLNIGGGGRAREISQTPREEILAAMGIGPDGIAGPGRFIGGQGDMAEANRWLALPAMTLEIVCEEIRRICAAKPDGPPKSFRYFTPAMQRLSGQLTAEPLTPTATNRQQEPTNGRISSARATDAAIAGLADEIRAGNVSFEDPRRNPW